MKNKNILVIGASGVLGSKISLKLLNQGFNIGMHFVNNHPEKKKIFQSFKKNYTCYQNKLESKKDCLNIINKFKKDFKSIYGVIYCGGKLFPKDFWKLNHEDWNKVYLNHCLIPTIFCQEASKKLEKGGRIVVMSSISVKYSGSTKTIHYASSKSALETNILALARETSKKKICINIVRPGFVFSPLSTNHRSNLEIKKRISLIPFERACTGEEVAELTSFFFNPLSSFVTGQIVSISGGD